MVTIHTPSEVEEVADVVDDARIEELRRVFTVMVTSFGSEGYAAALASLPEVTR